MIKVEEFRNVRDWDTKSTKERIAKGVDVSRVGDKGGVKVSRGYLCDLAGDEIIRENGARDVDKVVLILIREWFVSQSSVACISPRPQFRFDSLII